MHIIKLTIFISGVFLSLPGLLWASGKEDLNQYLKNTHTLKAQFEQTILDNKQRVLEKSSGKVQIKRPGRFRWEYEKPFSQLIVSNGKTIWLYDVDLEQVTVKPFDKQMGATPALLLSSDVSLDKQFRLKDLGKKEKLDWIQLSPKKEDLSFQVVRLAFDSSGPRVMELVDKMGQTTRLEFNQVERNPALIEQSFQFTPPKGVDVVGEDGQ